MGRLSLESERRVAVSLLTASRRQMRLRWDNLFHYFSRERIGRKTLKEIRTALKTMPVAEFRLWFARLQNSSRGPARQACILTRSMLSSVFPLRQMDFEEGVETGRIIVPSRGHKWPKSLG